MNPTTDDTSEHTTVEPDRGQPTLGDPIRVGPHQLRNRFVMTTHGPRLAPARYLRYLTERSRDVAMVGLHAIAGVIDFPFGPGRSPRSGWYDLDAVIPHPLTTDGRARLDEISEGLRAQTEVVHAGGALAIGQILHLGHAQQEDQLQPIVAPSAVPDEYRRWNPYPPTADELDAFVAACGEAAARARRAGVDGIEIHAAHGYLFQQFLSPVTNHRNDAYGGDATRRRRLLVDAVTAARAAVGDDAIVGVRLPAGETHAGGLDTDDIVALAEHLEQLGVDYLSVSAGNYTGLGNGVHTAYVAPPWVQACPAAGTAAAIRRRCSTPVVATGRITDPAVAAELVASGAADLIGLTRALIADPDFVAKALDRNDEPIRPCIGANECHRAATVACAVNPAAGREEELALRPPDNEAPSRRLLVIGGGPGGLEAARRGAASGLEVTLVESRDRLGGTLCALAAADPALGFGTYLDWLTGEVSRHGVDVRLGRRWTADDIERFGADHVIVAVGAVTASPLARPLTPPMMGVVDFLVDAPDAAEVIVVGGLDDHLAPLHAARAAAGRGARTHLLVEPLAPGEGVEPATRFAALRDLHREGVTVHTATALHAVAADGAVVLRDVLTGELRSGPRAEVIVAAGSRRARSGLVRALRRRGTPHRLVGDCVAPRRVVHATIDAARAVAELFDGVPAETAAAERS